MSKQDIPIIGPLLNRIIGTRNDRFVKKYNQRVAAINAIEPQMRALTDEQLRGKLGLAHRPLAALITPLEQHGHDACLIVVRQEDAELIGREGL